MKRAILGTIAAAALSASPLWAQDEDLFGKLDKNSDGVVTADEVEGDAKGVFERALRRGDKDGDKKLTKEEFAASLKETDTPRQPLAPGGGPGRPGGGVRTPLELFAPMDGNRDGKLSKDEAKGPILANFDLFDADKDGFITKAEIGRPGVLGAGDRPDPRQLEAQFERFDANKDGKLTKDEIPEGQRERFAQLLERVGGDSISKEQFPRFAGLLQGGRPGDGRPGQPGPGGPLGGGRPPLFVALDADNDGELSAGEIEASSKSLLKLDKNSDGKLTRDELFPGSPDGPPRGRPGEGRPGEGRPDAGRFIEQLRERIKAADADKDGKISKEEAGKEGAPPALKERFAQIDANSDGQLDETELRQMLQRREGGDRPQGRPEGRRPEGDRPEGGRPDAPRRE